MLHHGAATKCFTMGQLPNASPWGSYQMLHHGAATKCFTMGQLPNDWKIANVVPIHKKGDKSDVNNYRPTSLTSLVVKVIEICIRD